MRLNVLKRFDVRRSPALVAALCFALGGVGAAVGNLALARVLPAPEYAAVALVLAIIQLGITLGPLGWPTLINRYGFSASVGLLMHTVVSSALVGIAIAATAAVLYGLHESLVLLLALAVTLAAANRVAATLFQARQAFGASLFLTQIHNWVLLASVPFVSLLANRSATPVALVVVVGYAVTSAIGWRIAWRHRDAGVPAVFTRALLGEGLTIVAGFLALAILYQIDRLLIPRVLSLRDLATYAVAAAVIGSPFRMLQTGTGFTLLPRIRACVDAAAARKLIRHEATLMVATSAICTIVVIAAMPFVTTQVLGGRYEISRALIAAMLTVGFSRVWDGLATAVTTALGSPRELTHLSVSAWLAVLCAAACATAARSNGLVGVVYGFATGWVVHAFAASVIGANALRRRGTSREVRDVAVQAVRVR